MSTALSIREKSALAECEEIIERGLDSFVEVGNALLDAEDSMSSDDFKRLCVQKTGMHRDEIMPLLELAREVLR